MGLFGSIIGAVTGAAGSLFGSLGKNDEIDRQQRGIDEQNRRNSDWFNRRYDEEATQRADVQRLLSRTEEELRKRNKAAEGRKAVMGGTDESVAAEKEANGKILADVTSQIAASNERRKDLIEQQYLQRKNNLEDMRLGLEGNRQNAYDIAGGIISGASNGIKLGGGF